MIGRHSKLLSRTALVLFALAVAWTTSVRPPRAQPFNDTAFSGRGRATLTLADPARDPPTRVEVFARLTFATTSSSFERGLYIRSSFTLPAGFDGDDEAVALTLDLDRSGGRKTWELFADPNAAPSGSDSVAPRPAVIARLYSAHDRAASFDARLVAGRLELEASLVTRQAASFRVSGWLELADPGPDGVADTSDDRIFDLELRLESVPSPEELAGQGSSPPPRPIGGVCDPRWCWVDGAYYQTFYGYGCGEAVVDDGSTGEGCAGEPDPYGDDGTGDTASGCEGDDSTGWDDNGNLTYDDSGGCDGDGPVDGPDGGSDAGCEGDTQSGEGCESSDSSGACTGSQGGSGCSGCEGDAAPANGDEQRGTAIRGADAGGLGWIGGLLLGLAMALQLASSRSRR